MPVAIVVRQNRAIGMKKPMSIAPMSPQEGQRVRTGDVKGRGVGGLGVGWVYPAPNCIPRGG